MRLGAAAVQTAAWFGPRHATALNGQIKIGRGIRLGSWVVLVETAAMVTAGVFALAGAGRAVGVIAVLLGAWFAVKGRHHAAAGPQRC